jgi:lysyl-tRNA synthetase class I
MFSPRLKVACVRPSCSRVNKVKLPARLEEDTKLEYQCKCGQHNVLSLSAKRRRLNKVPSEPAVIPGDRDEELPE